MNYLDKKFNIRSDGRPILGMSAPDLVKICLSYPSAIFDLPGAYLDALVFRLRLQIRL